MVYNNRMKYYIICTLFAATFVTCLYTPQQNFEAAVKKTLETKIDTLMGILTSMGKATEEEKMKTAFVAARTQYKHIEPFIEYYFQGLTRRINGPALPDVKTDDNVVNDPAGFQVIEEVLFGDSIDVVELVKQIKILQTDLAFIKANVKDLPVQDHHFYELVQHQIIRIAALGITGFDSPVAFHSLTEAKASLVGILESYDLYCMVKKKKIDAELVARTRKVLQYLEQNNDFLTFNRLLFIKEHLMPLSEWWEKDFKSVIDQSPQLRENKVFSGHLAELMQGKKLNPDAFSPFAANASTPQKVALGKLLFNDVGLSKKNNMSCATCHNSQLAFTDGKVNSLGNVHSNTAKRNSPTLLYAAFQKAFFYDLRSQDLENQIGQVMDNPEEFNLSPAAIQSRVKNHPQVSAQVVAAYPGAKEIGAFEIRNAIAAYVRSLMPFASKIDRYFQGKLTLSEAEINGFNLFTGKAKCATCHFVPLYNGTVPPWFNNSESEVIGVPQKPIWNNAVVDGDVGRYQMNALPPFKYSFKTPTVRNIQKTAPYMHNGVYANLADVVQFYTLGGGNGIGMKLAYQTLPFDHLQLTEKEKNNIIQFLNALTDEK